MNRRPFTGFPLEGIQFLHDLAQNNNKIWFEAHKQTYLDALQNPAIALVETLGERLKQHFPEIGYDTRSNGSGTLMRMYRDTRFSADKSPYKTNVAMMFTPGTGKKMEVPGFGLQVTPEQVDVVAGIFAFPKSMLTFYRESVLDDKQGKALEEAIQAVHQAGNYTIGGETYKRIPSGYDASHPRAEWLKFTGLSVSPAAIGLDLAQTPALVDALMTHFVNMAPIQQWLTSIL